MLERTRNFIRQITRKTSNSAEDRRAHPRFDTEIETVCRPVADGEEHKAIIRDVSRSGVKLLLDVELVPGTMVRVDVPHAVNSAHTVTLLACVMRVIPESDDRWSCGCMFSLELNDDELAIFGGKKVQGAHGDQRAWIRHPVRAMAEYRVLPGEDDILLTAEVVNLSPAGVGLLLDRHLDPGSVLSVSLHRAKDKPDLSMLASIVYLTDCSDGRWAAGCNFIRELTHEELKSIV
ncbi:PilZ domain-containing protein [Zavarzinella formosa]|uniref:PilZ domain-containing protein n=1 Tax=Zavarzinella formosa TaxID=360055 RepID=UPI0002D9E9D8|nr:PilZ domain-containing protein [Zavarzinella formosa]